eukprot:TRINITY_DN13299_c0_g1_i1.p1 TRINITY_DN13299_c0_g1~~TRINITY_DN13299_c0_g1_i1.p1  ORF type:complete len:342 (+),score=76.93 TRINITY_DN13299_c0_g1_i1:40-1026(+)
MKRPASQVSQQDAKSSKFFRPSAAETTAAADVGDAAAEVRRKLHAVLEPIRRGLPGDYAQQRAALLDVATALMKRWQLCAGGERLRIAELEAYVHSATHADPYTHADEGQSTCGVWYFHRHGASFKAGSFKGLDIACGDAEAGVHAGLLIRSVIDSSGKLIEGPSLTVDLLLKLCGKASIAELVDSRAPDTLPCEATPELYLEPADGAEGLVHAGARVGLVLRAEAAGKTHSSGSPAAFCTRAYRFSSVPERLTKFRSGFAAVARLDGNHEVVSKLRIPAKMLDAYTSAVDDGLAAADPASFVDKKLATQADFCWLIGACEGLRRKLR